LQAGSTLSKTCRLRFCFYLSFNVELSLHAGSTLSKISAWHSVFVFALMSSSDVQHHIFVFFVKVVQTMQYWTYTLSFSSIIIIIIPRDFCEKKAQSPLTSTEPVFTTCLNTWFHFPFK
jgi:hypothetical protein